ncbi:MAG: Sua5 family C-terminal domain-containing protein, partial [Planctomycetota bacterium]
ERVVGPLRHPDADPARPTAPGQCSRHYAPRTPLVLCEDEDEAPGVPRAGLLAPAPPKGPGRFEAVEVLSTDGDLLEAASNLFAAMHRLDAMGLDLIVALRAPEQGLGLAINDRLRRAAHARSDDAGGSTRT